MLLALLLVPRLAVAQAELRGTVWRLEGNDTVPLADALVVIHRLTASQQGPIDSFLTNAAGQFSARVAADTTALLLASSRHAGIEYYSRPARAHPGRADTLMIYVADTSSRAPLRLVGRYLMIGRPEQQGFRGALDLIVIRNGGSLTRVAPDTTSPVWAVPLPPGIENFAPSESEFSAAALGFRADSLTIAAPITPGDRQLMVTYTLPRGIRRLAIPFAAATDSIVVLLEEPTARVRTPGFAVVDSQAIEGRTYRRWVGSLGDAGTVEVSFAVPGEGGREASWLLALLLAAALAGGGLLLLRRRAVVAAPAPPVGGDAAGLIEALARLDAAFAGRETEVGPARYSQYLAQRRELKAALDAALAGRPMA